MNMSNNTQRILSLKIYESEKIINAFQDRNREFINLLACISVIGIALSPALIYRSEAKFLQNSWFENFRVDDEAFFAIFANR